MQGLRQKDNQLHITLNTEDLTPTQIRLIKSVNSLLTHVLTADEEAEYFEFSAELLKKTAEAIKHSQFAESNKRINYGEQAVEYSVDFLNETLAGNKLSNIDN